MGMGRGMGMVREIHRDGTGNGDGHEDRERMHMEWSLLVLSALVYFENQAKMKYIFMKPSHVTEENIVASSSILLHTYSVGSIIPS